jgi:hypothetical protein
VCRETISREDPGIKDLNSVFELAGGEQIQGDTSDS